MIEKAKEMLEVYKKDQAVNNENIQKAVKSIDNLQVIREQIAGAIYAAEAIIKMMEEKAAEVITG